MTSRIASLVLIAGLAAGFVSTASAQDKAPARDGQPKVLEGPRVQDGGVPGERRRFGPGAQDKRDMQREIPHMMFMRVVNSLKGPQAESGERLSDEQVARINEIDGACGVAWPRCSAPIAARAARAKAVRRIAPQGRSVRPIERPAPIAPELRDVARRVMGRTPATRWPRVVSVAARRLTRPRPSRPAPA